MAYDDGDKRLMECGDSGVRHGADGCSFVCAIDVEDAADRRIQIYVGGIIGWWLFACIIEPSLDR